MQRKNSGECVKFCEKGDEKEMDWDRLAATVELSDKTTRTFTDSTYKSFIKAIPTPWTQVTP